MRSWQLIALAIILGSDIPEGEFDYHWSLKYQIPAKCAGIAPVGTCLHDESSIYMKLVID